MWISVKELKRRLIFFREIMAIVKIHPKELESAGILKIIINSIELDEGNPKNIRILMLRDYANDNLLDKYKGFTIDGMEPITLKIPDNIWSPKLTKRHGNEFTKSKPSYAGGCYIA